MSDSVPEDVINNIPRTHFSKSDIHGHGLFATEGFSAEEQLCVLDGQRVSWRVYSRRKGFSGEWNATTGDVLVIRPFRTRYFYINHSRSPNLQVLEDPLRVVALREIAAGEELLLDYRREPLPEEYMQTHGSTYL
jgi:SET domain-containing protein